MPKFTAHFQAGASASATVEADDYDEAIDKAHDEITGGLCAYCSGYGQSYGKDIGDFEVYEVTDESGETVWSTPSYTDGLLATIDKLRAELEEARKPKA